jgi:hypothetical protein
MGGLFVLIYKESWLPTRNALIRQPIFRHVVWAVSTVCEDGRWDDSGRQSDSLK